MAFLTKKETSLITLIKASPNITVLEKENNIEQIKFIASLRSDGHKKPVKVVLSALASFRIDSIASMTL
ncbi:hypothetical protein HDC90_001119 [Pedobacter sp. AK013]|nr:hypothetical protein [Pedobacter sp. AK013]